MLYLLPDELLVAIVEYCDQRARKSLSLVSRRLRNPSQRTIFKTVYIPRNTIEVIVPRFAVKIRDQFPEMIRNDRLLSYIQTIIISQGDALHYLRMVAMELLFTALHVRIIAVSMPERPRLPARPFDLACSIRLETRLHSTD